MADIHDLVRTDYKEVDKRDGLHSVMGWVKGDTDKRPIVTDQGRPYGIVNDRALTTRRLDHRAKVENYTLPTRALPANVEVGEAIRRMAEFRAAYLPVEEKGRTLGFVSSVDLVREAGWDRTAGELCVPVATLREGQTLGDAMHLFSQEYIDHIPVFDVAGRLKWALSRRKLLEIESNSGQMRGRKDAGGEKISYLADPIDGFCDDVVTLPAGADGEEVLRTLEEWGYACVVTPEGRLEGIITPETLPRSAPPR